MSSNEPTTLITDYLNITKEYQAKYGERTILLYQVGAFYEIYGLKNAKTGNVAGSKITDFCQTHQLNISEKKVCVGQDQVVMAGFRDYTLEKYLPKITESGYTAVVYVQEKSGKTFVRRLHSVYSAGTFISYDTDSSSQITNNIMCIWIEHITPIIRSNIRDNLVLGMAVANIFTGKSSIFEYQTPFLMNPTTFDELERYISVYSPSEIIIISSLESEQTARIVQYSGIITTNIHYVYRPGEAKAELCTQQKYVQHILSAFYGEEAYQICSEFQLHTIAVQAFCYLLNFIQEHNPNLVRKIALPEFNNTSYHMILANHTLKQLNIISDNRETGHLSSVSAFLNKCSSPMGKRLFQKQIVNPTFDEAWLNQEYDMINQMINANHDNILKKQLGEIRDLEKIGRQLVLGKVFPSSIYFLYKSIENIQNLETMLEPFAAYLCKDFDSSGILAFLNEHLLIDNCIALQTFTENIFKAGVSKPLDNVIEKHQKQVRDFQAIHKYFNGLLRTGESDTTEYVKIHQTEKSGSSLQITKKRGQLLKQALKNAGPTVQITGISIQVDDIKFVSASTTNDEIVFNQLTKICRDQMLLMDSINEITAVTYAEFLKSLENAWLETIEKMAKYVAKIDVLFTKAHISKKYNYCRPQIDADANKSYVNAKALRHCLIEHLQQNELYVTNDLSLGKSMEKGTGKGTTIEEQNGILLYGTNAVGKTSIIRALGIATIMAQAGMYVPCSQFVYKPYTAIYSRILGTDNIFKGLSTFAVEMSELRVILKMADQNSLILGDELCSGTETESALSIFVAGLTNLHEKQASFVFATHFHEIIHYDEIKQLTNLKLKHMSVTYDRERDCLVYDRLLKDGPGDRMYGLEVCKSLYLDEDFLQMAYNIRNKYFPEGRGELSNPTTVYNARKIRGICEMCKENMGEETHHLQPQKSANSDGFIGSFHKNHVANLISICEKCHQKEHDQQPANQLKIKKKTTKGFILGNSPKL